MRSRKGGAATIAAAGGSDAARPRLPDRHRALALLVGRQASTRSGLLSTAGNLLFAGDSANSFVAFAAARGVPLWRAGQHASVTNGPITYQLDGIQYVVVAANDTLYAFWSRAAG